MAVHNSMEFLSDAVESILNQNFTDFEFIIIDDGSTDGSGEWLEAKAKEDPRIRLVRQENIGLTKSLNRGLALARGEFIARMDADDISLSDRFQIQLNIMQANPEVVALGGSPIYIDCKGKPLFQRKMPLDHDEICKAHLTGWGGFIVHPSAMLKTSTLTRIGYYDQNLRYAQDYDLWCRLSRNGKLKNILDPLILYRYHNKSITNKANADQSAAVQSILSRELCLSNNKTMLKLNSVFEIHPEDDFWLLKAACLSSCCCTAYRIGFKVIMKELRLLYVTFKYLLLVSVFAFTKKCKSTRV